MRYLVFFAITLAFVVAYDVEVGQERDISVGDPEHLDDLQFGPNTQRGNSCTINQAGGDMYIYNYGNYGEPTSCKDLRMCGPRSGAYQLNLPGYGEASVYCHMQDLGNCGGGQWTLVMKTDGTKRTFHYDSHLWTDKNPYNILGGATGLDFQETKLPTYWTTPFTKICLGMKYGQDRFILVHKAADSLYSLIADGQYRATSVGRLTWKSLIGSQASLQYNCNKEGFNLISIDSQGYSYSKARIGILGNNQDYCGDCNSRIGFGTGGPPDDSNTCGNAANGQYNPDNGGKYIKAMGYIFVQ